jgi:hypothetical protein
VTQLSLAPLKILVASGTSEISDRGWIAGDEGVGGEEGDAFDHRLGNEETIKRIFVDGRKGVDGDGVLAGDG